MTMTQPTTSAATRALRSAVERLGLTGPQPVGRGLEFEVWRATHPRWGEVALRIPARKVDSNDNDPWVETAELLRHEAEMYRCLGPLGIPVPRVYDLLSLDVDVLVCEFLAPDGSTFRSYDLGAILARLHGLPPPATVSAGRRFAAFRPSIAERLSRRWAVLTDLGLVRDAPAGSDLRLPTAPHATEITGRIPPDGEQALLHLDVRASNLIVRRGRISALIDWSNSMTGDPALDLARIHESSRLPENGIDFGAFRRGYTSVRPWPERSPETWQVYHLDAAVMLAVVFTSEAPDPERGPALVRRVFELSASWQAPAGGSAW